MGLKDIYFRAIEDVVNETMSKEDLWDVFSEHLDDKYRENERLSDALYDLQKKYNHLLEQVNVAHEEHEKYIKHL